MSEWKNRSRKGTFLSLGAGTQSSVLALMAANGEIPKFHWREDFPLLDAAIFSDTHWEPPEIYDHLDWLETEIARSKHPFPVFRVDLGRSLKQDVKDIVGHSGKPYITIPVKIGEIGEKRGLNRRQCTAWYKIVPIERAARKIFDPEKGKEYTEQWIGISSDEIERANGSRKKWIKTEWPLIDMKMKRQDCIDWFKSNYPNRELYASSCIGCPYRKNSSWVEIRKRYPEEFNEIVLMERNIQDYAQKIGMSKPFFHNKRINLDEAVDSAESSFKKFDLDDQDGECGGNCFT